MLGLNEAFFSQAASHFGISGQRTIVASNDDAWLKGRVAVQLSTLIQSGIDPKDFLSVSVSGDSPSLPTPLFSRAAVFSKIAKLFDSSRIAGIADYSESGKSTTVAEFVSYLDCDCFWFNVPERIGDDDDWIGIFALSLSVKLGEPVWRPEDLARLLSACEKPHWIVIDDAHLIGTFSKLNPIINALQSNPRLNLLLVGVDTTEFKSSMRAKGIATIRIPGLSKAECHRMVGLPIEQKSLQSVALDSLRARSGGHIGLIRLGWPDIQKIHTEEQLVEYLAALPEGSNINLESMQFALIQQLRKGLTDEESLLCRRLSLAVTDFRRAVGESLWKLDREFADFAAVWGNCISKVFESRESGRFTIPEVYEAGFRQELADEDKPKLHDAIADGFAAINNKQLDYWDVHALVFHRYSSGKVDEAMHTAAMYVNYASGPGGRQAKEFFLRRFDFIFGFTERSRPTSEMLQWYAVRLRVYDELGDSSSSAKAALDLRSILASLDTQDSQVASIESQQLGWLSVLMYAAKHADPDLAMEIAKRIDRNYSPRLPRLPLRWDVFMVLTAALPSNKPILPYLENIIQGTNAKSFSGWYQSESIHAYQFWRFIASRLYQDFFRRADESDRDEDSNRIKRLVAILWQHGVHDIAAILECSLVRIEIDFYRDFVVAEKRSIELTKMAKQTCDQEVTVHVLQTRADALRCSDRDEEAIVVYKEAIETKPVSDWSEEADLYLMLGISQAKFGQWGDASRSAERSAHIFASIKMGDHSLNRLAAAKSWLEGAGFAIHGNEYNRAARMLIQTHATMTEEQHDHPLWAALAQISWSLVNCIQPEAANPQPPIPGFTLNLKESEESRAMQRSAVPLMLGRVCQAVGRPYRSIQFFELAIKQSTSPDHRSSSAFFGVDAALDVKEIVFASKYAVLMAAYLFGQVGFSSPTGRAFLLDHILGRVFRVITEQIGTPNFEHRLRKSIQVVDQETQKSEPEELFYECLVSLQYALKTSDWAKLDTVFRHCETMQAGWLAKEIAWIACYRCHPATIHETDFLKWHYRVVRCSLTVGQQDHSYIQRVLDQQYAYWKRIPVESRSGRTEAVIAAIESASNDFNGLLSVASVLGREHATVSSLDEAIDELRTQIEIPHGLLIADGAIEQISLRFLDLCLSPFATRNAPRIVEKLDPLARLVSATDAAETIKTEFNALLALGNALNGAGISTEAFNAVRRVSQVAESITADSAAQGFVYMRHWLQFAPRDFGYEQIAAELAKPRVSSILNNPDLSNFMRIRLKVAHVVSIVFFAQRKLTESLARMRTQQQGRAPVREDAILKAISDRDSSLEKIVNAISSLEYAAADARESNFSIEEWNALNELACVLQLLGATLLRFGDPELNGEKHLREAIQAFKQAVGAIAPNDLVVVFGEQEAEMLAKSAFSGRELCREMQDNESLKFFEAIIERIVTDGRFADSIERQKLAESKSIIKIMGDSGDSKSDDFNDEEFEEQVQLMVDHMMESMGWPEDRREFVESDIRKLRICDQAKATFCKHLLPLQDLEHLRHPATVYAEETNYTIGCALLRHTTKIGVSDIEIAIAAMKSTYCNGCKYREAGDSANESES